MEHDAIRGRREWVVPKFRVGEIEPDDPYAKSVLVSIVEPRKRTWLHSRIVDRRDDVIFLTIEVEGCVVYDSREDVPCDMERFRVLEIRARAEEEAIAKRFAADFAGRNDVRRRVRVPNYD